MGNNIPLIIYSCAYRLNNFPILAQNLVDSINLISPLVAKDFGIDKIDIVWLICKDTRTAYGDIGETFKILDEHKIQYCYYERASSSETWHNFDEKQIEFGLKNFLKEQPNDYNPYFYMWDDDNLLNPQMLYSYYYTINTDGYKDILNFKMIDELGSTEMSFEYTLNWWINMYQWVAQLPSDPSKNMLRMSIVKKYGFFVNLFSVFEGNKDFKDLATKNLRSPIFEKEKDSFPILDKMGDQAYDRSWYGPVLQMEYNQNNVTFVNRATRLDTYHNGLWSADNFKNYKSLIDNKTPLQGHLFIKEITRTKNDDDYCRNWRSTLPLDQELLEKLYPIIYDYYKEKYNYDI